MRKQCYIIAGPNGSGKTTFAETYLPLEGECVNFVNADLIAAGLSPLQPELANAEAGRLLLKRIESFAKRGEPFAFETTLSGKNYLRRIAAWQELGYRVSMFFLRLPSVEIAIDRVKMRVLQGGHDIPEADIRRRYVRGWINFDKHYRDLVDSWIVFENSEDSPVVLEQSE